MRLNAPKRRGPTHVLPRSLLLPALAGAAAALPKLCRGPRALVACDISAHEYSLKVL